MASVESSLTLTSQGVLIAPLWTPNHTTTNGNYYKVGTLVNYEIDGVLLVHKCIADNDSIVPTNTTYWINLGPGYLIQQEKSDWNAIDGDSQILNKPDLTGYITDAPNDGSQYVRKNETWNKLTNYSEDNPTSASTPLNGFPLGSDWYNTVTGEKFYQKANGVWISYTSSTPPVDGGDSPVVFANLATTVQLPNSPVYDNGVGGLGATLTASINGVLSVDGPVGSTVVGDTILVKDQPPFDPDTELDFRYQNGIYILSQQGSSTLPYILTRVDYADESAELYPSQVNILNGATNKNRYFLQQTEDPNVGLDPVDYSINYVPPTQVVVLPLIHVDTATTEPLPDCTYVDEFPTPIPGTPYLSIPVMSYLTANTNGPLGIINGVDMSITFGYRNTRILVKNQADPIQNGDYQIVQAGSSVQPWKLKRITTTYSSFNKNTREWKINNEASTLYGNRYYMNYTGSFGVVGTTPITFSELTPGSIQNLQDVTDIGAITTNTITVGDLADNFSQVLNGAVGTQNAVTGTYAYLDSSGQLGLHNGDVESDLKNTNVTNSGVILEFPNKTTGSYTIATTADIPTITTPSLQDVIDVNKVADRVEFAFMSFNGSAFTGGYDYLIDFMESNQDNGIYIYGDFAQYGTSTGQDIVKVNSDGTIDTSFNVGTGFNNYPYTGSGKLAQTAAGKLYVSGSFTTYNGTTVNRIVRLNTNGTIDSSFITGSGFYGGLNYTNSIGLDSSENVYVAGGCTYYNGTSIPLFVKLLPNGSIDTSFVIGSGFDNTTTAILVNSDNTLFVGGHFGTYKGTSSPRFVKLLPNGDIDTSFVIGTGFGGGIVTGIVKTIDNKIIVIGSFTTYKGVSANKIIKLNLDGSRDTSFDIGTGFSGDIYLPKLLLDGKLSIIADPGTYNGVSITSLVVLNTDGSIFLNPSHSYTGFSPLSDGRFIGMSNTGTTDNYLVQVVNGLPFKGQKLTFSEITGKAEYNIETLTGTTTYELLPKHLIETLITDSISGISVPSLQDVTTIGNTSNAEIISNTAFTVLSSDIPDEFAYLARLGIIGVFQSGIWKYGGTFELRAPSTDGSGFTAMVLPTSSLSADRTFYLPNKNGTLAVTTDILPVDANPVNGSNNPVSSNGVFDALALKADLVSGKVPSSQLPSYVDDVIEGYYNTGVFYSDVGLTTPITGETGKIYVDLLANKSYRWSGSVYVQISNAISSIDELTDVTVSSPTNGQLLQYNTTTSQWENQSIVVGTGDMQKSTYDTDNDGVVDYAESVPVTVRNPSTSEILRKGRLVYLSGSTGYRPNAYYAQANSESTSSGTFGVVISDIGLNSDGLVAPLGTLHNLDTRNAANGNPYPFTNDVLVDGDPLWLSPTTAGYVTKTKPQAPNHIVFIGTVARTHPTLGRIVYRIVNGFELDELHNVFINGTLADKHTLYYDSATSLWKTNTVSGVLGYTPQELLLSGSNIKTINGTSILGSGDIVISGSGVSLTRQEFTYSSSQSFTLSATPSYIYGVFVNGQELNSSQYSITTNVLTIIGTLQIVNGIPDSVNIIYSESAVGVLDYYTKLQIDAFFSLKQDTLVSGTNIKTINGDSIIGSGDITVSNLGITLALQSLNFLT